MKVLLRVARLMLCQRLMLFKGPNKAFRDPWKDLEYRAINWVPSLFPVCEAKNIVIKYLVKLSDIKI